MTRGLKLPARGAAAPWRLAVALALVAALLLAPLPAPASAATRTVTTGADSGADSLRQIIAAAVAGDTITFAPYVTTVTLTSGELAINKNLTIQGSGVGGVRVERSTAVGTPDFRIFHITAGTVAISGLTIANGRTPNSGGGVRISGGAATLTDVTVSGNAADTAGGGLYVQNDGSTLTLTGSTVSGNTSAQSQGGGVAVFTGVVATLTGSTVSGNTATQGGGLYASGTGSTLTPTSTIVAGNGGGNCATAAGGAINDGHSNLDDGTSCGFGGSLTGIPALLAPLGNYGGPTQTHALLPGSPALDQASCAGLTTDQRGVARPQPGAAPCDVGAFESRRFDLALVGGNNQSAAINAPFASPLVVAVTSTFGEPVAGGVVAFYGPGSGAGLQGSSLTATIAADGRASATATANGTVGGPYTVIATAHGTTNTVSFSLINTIIPTTLVAASASGSYDGTAALSATLTATGGAGVAGQTIAFTLNGTPAGTAVTDGSGVATLDNASLAGIAAGSYPTGVGAAFAGTAQYQANTASAPLAVAQATQTITLIPDPLPDGTYGDVSFDVTATATSGLPVALAADGACSIAGATVTLTGAGTCTVTASQPGDANWLPAPDVTRVVGIAKAPQTIAFPQPSPAAHGDPPFTVTATATSGLPATFTAGPAGVCTASGASGATITLVGPGACTIVAHQPGDANHLPAPDVPRVVGVAPCDGQFFDVAADDPACPAIVALVRAGVIKGYATTPPTFGPDDNVQRAQLAAFLVRALGWQNRPTGPHSFDDFDGLVAELQRASLILTNACDSQGTCVARGYGDGRFGPTDPVTRAQAITLIARAFRLDPAFAWAPGTPAPGAPAQHAADIGMYIANAGAIPDAPTSQAEWDAPASRAWVAMALWQALLTLP